MTKFISLSIVFLLTFTSAIAQNLTLPLVFSDQMVGSTRSGTTDSKCQ